MKKFDTERTESGMARTYEDLVSQVEQVDRDIIAKQAELSQCWSLRERLRKELDEMGFPAPEPFSSPHAPTQSPPATDGDWFTPGPWNGSHGAWDQGGLFAPRPSPQPVTQPLKADVQARRRSDGTEFVMVAIRTEVLVGAPFRPWLLGTPDGNEPHLMFTRGGVAELTGAMCRREAPLHRWTMPARPESEMVYVCAQCTHVAMPYDWSLHKAIYEKTGR